MVWVIRGNELECIGLEMEDRWESFGNEGSER